MFVGFSCGFKELEQEEGTRRRRTNLNKKTVCEIEGDNGTRRRQWNLNKMFYETVAAIFECFKKTLRVGLRV